jgi:hypothetical protein
VRHYRHEADLWQGQPPRRRTARTSSCIVRPACRM